MWKVARPFEDKTVPARLLYIVKSMNNKKYQLHIANLLRTAATAGKAKTQWLFAKSPVVFKDTLTYFRINDFEPRTLEATRYHFIFEQLEKLYRVFKW